MSPEFMEVPMLTILDRFLDWLEAWREGRRRCKDCGVRARELVGKGRIEASGLCTRCEHFDEDFREELRGME